MTDRQLVLIRHAKAARGDVDIDRPLTSRGTRDAVELGRWLAAHAVSPDRVVISPSLRTIQTWAHADSVLSAGIDVHPDPRIYGNTLAALISVIQQTPDAAHTLLMVGHNPSMIELAFTLDNELGSVDARGELAHGFPTSGVAMFTVPTAWSECDEHSATLTAFGRPRA